MFRASALLSSLAFAVALAPAALAQTPRWHTDLEAAKALATKESKPLFVDFTGSEWCPYCVLLEKEVIKSPEFAREASRFVLVKLDFPPRSGRSAEALQKNPELKKLLELKDAYKISGFPTVVLLNADGTERNRVSGYKKGQGPTSYLAELEQKR